MEIEWRDLESQRVLPRRMQGIRWRRRHHISYDAICELLHNFSVTDAFLVVLEIVSLLSTALGKNKWEFLLVACSASFLAFVTNVVLYARRRAEQLEIPVVVDIGSSFIQFVTTLIYLVLAIRHIRIGFNESLLPLYFAVTRFLSSRISSRRPAPGVTPTTGDSLNPETRTTTVTNSDPPTSQIMPIREAATGSSSCEILSSPTISTAAHVSEGSNHSTPVNVTNSSSCDSISDDPSSSASTALDIHEELNQSSPAPLMPQSDNEAKIDGLDPSSSVSTALDIHEELIQSSPATLVPQTDDEAEVEAEVDGLDPSSSAFTALDVYEELNQSSPVTLVPQTDNEAKIDDFKSMQLFAEMGGSMSVHDIKYTSSSSCELQQLSSGCLTSEQNWTTTVHTHEPLSHAQSDLSDNEANGNECLLQDVEENYVTSE